jgi:hypothetical protein
MLVDTAAHGGVALRIEVHKEYPLVGRSETRCQVDPGRSFAYAAFLVRDREYSGQGALSLTRDQDEVALGVEPGHFQRNHLAHSERIRQQR